MYDVFGSIRGLLKIDSVSIDNNIFRLHYKATMFILVAFSLLVTQKQYFGDPIDCIVEGVDAGIMDTYCWIHSTFTIPALTGAVVGQEVPHPGVANPEQHGSDDQHETKHHKYYQWVTLFLYLQAIMFYVPRYLWKIWEGGKVKNLVMELNSPIVEDDAKRERKTMLVNYFSQNLHNHNFYAFRFFVCELLNFVNVIGQIYFTDRFLGYEFTTYGTRVIQFSEQELGSRHDPMDEVFPKVAKCTFHKYGASGSIERHDGLCVLPLNIFNEKIYIFLWFWFIIVAVVSGVGLLYRMATFTPAFRQILLRTRSRLASPENVEAISRKCQIGDWFVLYQLAKNMDPLIYKEFITDLANKLQGKGPFLSIKMSMYDVFADVKNILKVSSVNTDNTIFRLHYKATMVLLIACSLLVTQRQYFGDPIDCDVDPNYIDQGIMDTYCWIHSTYTLPYVGGKVGHDVAHPGVGPDHDIHTGERHETKHHKYYQWVVIVLFLQALMFYIPKYIWMACEGGKIKMLAADLNSPIVDDAMKKERKDMLVKYFSNNVNAQNAYAFKFFTCEVLNFANVIGQIYFTNRFLGGEFLTYGTDVVKVSESDMASRQDAMDQVFPKVAKCTFELYGGSGSVGRHDGLCVLPLNIINEKIYILLWFWFIVVAVMSGIAVLYRVATVVLPGFRTILLRVRSKLSDPTDIQDVAHKSEIGEWFLLYQLTKNIDPLIYKEFIHDLAMKRRGNGPI
ncbi:uncharacterized protein [Palaemon carinicauda]|uniref:uncharacterized protein n=1 Tax=Palaemon carinicauda TaxID=392227 RepID=UPI0035B6367A